MRTTLVRELISRDDIVATPEMTMTDLVKLFGAHSVRGVAVVDPEMKLVGVVTETDLFLKQRGIAFSLEKVPTILGQVVDPAEVEEMDAGRSVTVGEVMSRSVVTIAPDASLWEAAQLMTDRRHSLLPVTEDGRWIGTVRRIAILKRIYGGDTGE